MDKKIINFCIIAHIDHGKSTLADRFLELTGSVEQRKMQEQFLDQMELERERGITIKLQPVRMEYRDYILNLIDTPGHVDFSYEVSRSLAACEGALLLVDATQGIQAQTLANLYLALEEGLEIIPVLNKIDLPNADVESNREALCNLLGCKKNEIYLVSAKTGKGVEELLLGILEKVPRAGSQKDEPFRALIFDSIYDDFQGVVAHVRVMEGTIKKGDKLVVLSTGEDIEITELGVFLPKRFKKEDLVAGEVGYIVTGFKELGECSVGDTLAQRRGLEPLPGYEKVRPMVFASFCPVEAGDFENLRDALEKLSLNDASLSFEAESSQVLGRCFRCGFLGLLHLDIIQERLSREYRLDLVITIPSVAYKVFLKSGEKLDLRSPAEFPEMGDIEKIEEPWVRMEIILPLEMMSKVMDMCKGYRGEYKSTDYLEKERIVLKYEIPLASVVTDFYDKLKGVSSGYASASYEPFVYREGDLVKLEILVAGEPADPFARIVSKDVAFKEGKRMVKRLKELLPRQNFEIPIQAVIGGKILARETLKAFRKDVTGYLYGGDVSRKRKLLEKQKKGKKKMKQFGKVEIPQKVFLDVMKKEE